MRNLVFAILMFLMVFFHCQMQTLYAIEEEGKILVQKYFENLKIGDTSAILNILTDPILSEKRDLLENNPAYSSFLQKIYANSHIEINNMAATESGKKSVNVAIYFNDQGPPQKARFILKLEDNVWKISEEMNEF